MAQDANLNSSNPKEKEAAPTKKEEKTEVLPSVEEYQTEAGDSIDSAVVAKPHSFPAGTIDTATQDESENYGGGLKNPFRPPPPLIDE